MSFVVLVVQHFIEKNEKKFEMFFNEGNAEADAVTTFYMLHWHFYNATHQSIASRLLTPVKY